MTACFRFLILTAIVVGCFCASAAAQPADTWTSLRTKNFSLIGNASLQQLQQTTTRLEEFRWAISRLCPRLRLDNGRPTQIVIFRDAQGYFEFLPKRPDGTVDIGVAGYFQAGDDINYITFAISPRQIDPYSTAVHEFFHSVLDANFERSQLQPWLSEGLAEYFETVRISGRLIVVGEEQPEHLRLLRRSALIPLGDLLSFTTTEIRMMSPERRRLYYAQSWALVRLLMQKRAISLSGLTDGADNIRADAELEYELIKSIRSPSLPGEAYPVETSAPLVESAVSANVAMPEVFQILGDLLFHTGEFVRSEAFLRKALLDDPDRPAANASLGLLMLRQEKLAEARVFLQKAFNSDTSNYIALSGFALVTIRTFARDGAEIPDDVAQDVRTALKRAIDFGPNYTESYRLLALLNFIRDEDLDTATAILQKALLIKPDDADLRILFARILLRREDTVRAREIAEQVAAASPDIKRKAEADEIIRAAYDYSRAKAAASRPAARLNVSLDDRPPVVILKRSWLTDADVTQIDRERINNNFNRLIIRPVVGERSLLGRIQKIVCSGSSITYRIRTGDSELNLTSTDFSSIRMTVAKEGQNSFQIGCGAELQKELVVINFRPGPNGSSRIAGELRSVSFVPDDFRLKTIQEMLSARLVAIDDDTLKRSGVRSPITTESIRRSILQYLRKPLKDEIRMVGTVQKIECVESRVDFSVLSGGRTYTLSNGASGKVEIGWFTVTSSQLALSCGGGPLASNAIITFSPTGRFSAADGELVAIEFVPDGFVP